MYFHLFRQLRVIRARVRLISTRVSGSTHLITDRLGDSKLISTRGSGSSSDHHGSARVPRLILAWSSGLGPSSSRMARESRHISARFGARAQKHHGSTILARLGDKHEARHGSFWFGSRLGFRGSGLVTRSLAQINSAQPGIRLDLVRGSVIRSRAEAHYSDDSARLGPKLDRNLSSVIGLGMAQSVRGWLSSVLSLLDSTRLDSRPGSGSVVGSVLFGAQLGSKLDLTLLSSVLESTRVRAGLRVGFRCLTRN